MDSQQAAGSPADKKETIYEIIGLFAQFQQKFEQEDDDEKRWLMQQTNNKTILAFLEDKSTLALHVLECIGRLEPVNGISIAKTMNMLKGTISKITRKLMAGELISSEPVPGNKKEIMFRLTPDGRELFELHERMHRVIERNVVRFYERFDSDELELMRRVMRESAEMSWLDLPEPENRKRS